MLGKLLKYDLKNMLKFLSVFYIIALVISIPTRIFLGYSTPLILNIIGKVLSGTLIAIFCNILINCLMRSWIKSFIYGIYGDEGYLTNTLPVTKAEIYLSKFLCAVISTALSIAVIFACTFIAYYTEERWALLKSIIPSLRFAAIFLGVCCLEFLSLIQCGFTGAIIGHRQNRGKKGFSVLFGFITYTAWQLVVLLFSAGAALFSGDFKELFVTASATTNPAMAENLLLWAIPLYAVIIIANLFINIKLLNRGVNLD